MDYHVDRITLDPQTAAVVVGSAALDGVAAFLGRAFGQVQTAMAAAGVAPAGLPFARFTMTADGFDVEAGWPIAGRLEPADDVVETTLPGGMALAILHRGPYETLPAAYRAGEEWLAANQWEANGDPWEVYLDGPDVAVPRTIVHMPARPR